MVNFMVLTNKKINLIFHHCKVRFNYLNVIRNIFGLIFKDSPGKGWIILKKKFDDRSLNKKYGKKKFNFKCFDENFYRRKFLK